MTDLPERLGRRPRPLPFRLARLRRRTRARWSVAPANLKGSLLMVSGFVVFGVMVAAIKELGPSIPLPQLLVIRQIIMTALLSPLFLPDAGEALRTRSVPLQVTRGLCSLGSMLFGFTAIQHIPLADATALGFSQILFVTILAVLILKETVGRHRWTATAVGFVGVLVMLRPGQGGLDHHAVFAVAGAVCASGMTISVRLLSHGERTTTILLYQAMVLMVVMIGPAIWMWVTPTLEQWLLMLAVGVSGTFGQFLTTRAYQVGEAAALAPLDFTRLLVNTGIGILIFSEFPDIGTAAGALLVVGSTLYVLRRNALSRS